MPEGDAGMGVIERKWTILVCPACDVGPRMGMSHGACPECGRKGASRTIEVVPAEQLRGAVDAGLREIVAEAKRDMPERDAATAEHTIDLRERIGELVLNALRGQ